MSINLIIPLLVVLFAAGALLAAWAGIRSIQSARSVVFYRTRRARMMAGWQWLAAAVALTLFSVAFMFFGSPVIGQIFSPTMAPATLPAPTLSSLLTDTPRPLASQTSTDVFPATTSTPESTATASLTPSRTSVVNGTFTALAIWTERRSTFIARLSETPTASRTPIPTWTRTPSSTPRPTYTPSATRTLRPTWTPSLTQTPRPTATLSSTSTLTLTPTRTPTRMPSPTP